MTQTQCSAETSDLAKSYQPTPPEQAVLATHRARKQAAAPSPRLKVSQCDGVTKIGVDHPKPTVAQVAPP